MRSKYETHVLPYLDRIKLWVAKGATVEEVADKLHTTRKSLYEWRKTHSDLRDAFAQGAVADDEVEAALYKRCTGYDYEEVQKYQVLGRDGKLIWLEKRYTRHLPPDPTSIQFWLTNRRKGEWKRSPETQAEEKDDESGIAMLPEIKDEQVRL